jgi:hypothetical protein
MKELLASIYPNSYSETYTSFNPVVFIYQKYLGLLDYILFLIHRFDRETRANTGRVIDLEKNALVEDGQDSGATPPEIEHASLLAPINYSPDKNPKKKKSGNKKKFLAGGAAGGTVGILMFITTVMPGFIINHLKDIATGKVNELQTRQQSNYRRSKVGKISDVFSRDGRMGSKIIADMEVHGYSFRFGDPTDRNKISGITLPGGRETLLNNEFNSVGTHMSEYMEVRHPFRSARWKTKRMSALMARYKVNVELAPITAKPGDPADPDQTVNKNLFADANEGKVDPDIINERALADDATDLDREAREAADSLARNSGDLDDISTALAAGIDKDTLGDTAQVLDEIGQGHGVKLPRFITGIQDRISATAKSFSVAKGAFTSANFLDKICIVKNRLKTAVTAARTSRAAAQMRGTLSVIASSDATKTGKADPKLLGSLLGRTTQKDSNGNPIGASSGFGYALKNKFSKSKNDSTRSAYAVDGTLTGPVGTLQDTTNISNCPLYQDPVFQITSGIAEVFAGIFSGGSAKAAAVGMKTAVISAVKNSMTRAVAKSVGKGLLRGAVIELSFEGVMILAQMYAERTLTLNQTGQEEGALFGEKYIAGAGTIGLRQNSDAGQVPATVEQYQVAHTRYLAEKQEEIDNQSFFARMFDYNNLDSFAFSSVFSVPMTFNGLSSTVASAAGNLFSAPQALASSFTQYATPKAYAQDDDIIAFDTYVTEGMNSGMRLATDTAGNLQTIIREDIAAIDLDENKDYLMLNGYTDGEDQPIGLFEDHVENCVNALDVISRIEGSDQTNPANDCLANEDLTKRFKAHLGFLTIMDSLEAEFYPETLDGTRPTEELLTATINRNGLSWPVVQSQQEAADNLGTCLDNAGSSICDAGHNYQAHDLFAPEGTPIVAAASGVVLSARVGSCGHGINEAWAVQIYDEENNITYFYQHMNPSETFQLVAAGDNVGAGRQLGVVGDTASACNTPPHLHFDAVAARGRPACSRLSCTTENLNLFVDIGEGLYDAYTTLSN